MTYVNGNQILLDLGDRNKLIDLCLRNVTHVTSHSIRIGY